MRKWTLVATIGIAMAAAVGVAPVGADQATGPRVLEECNDGDARTSVVKRTVDLGPGPDRSYWLSVPPGGVTNAPLLVSLHGSGNAGGCVHAEYTRWASYSIDSGRNFVVIYPDAVGVGWDYDAVSNDVSFVRAAVSAVQSEVSIDASRIYATAHSAGGAFAQRLACDAEDLFASVSVYAGYSPGEPCDLSRGIAMGFWHGDTDAVVDIDTFGRASRDEWAARELCTTRSPASGEPTRVTWSGCRDGVKVEWTVLTGQGHDWPTGASNDTMRGEMWTFFDTFPLP